MSAKILSYPQVREKTRLDLRRQDTSSLAAIVNTRIAVLRAAGDKRPCVLSHCLPQHFTPWSN